MRTAAFLLCVGVAAVVGFSGTPMSAAPVPKHLMKEAENTEQSKLQGTWKLESVSLGNMPLQAGGQNALEMTLEFRGDKMSGNSQGKALSATIKLDVADGVNRLATINTQTTDNQGKPAKEEDVTFGYVIDGDKLTLATTMGGKVKGAVDPTKPGNDTVVLVLTRIKEKN